MRVWSIPGILHSMLEALLWSETDDDGLPLDRRFTVLDFARETVARLRRDAADFVLSTGGILRQTGLTDEDIGHKFILNRNRHGTGFWDDGSLEGRLLSEASHGFGEVGLYLGDDGRLHGAFSEATVPVPAGGG